MIGITSNRGRLFPHGTSLQVDPDGVVEQSVEHGVSDGGIGEELVPFTRRHLAGDERGVSLGPVVDHLEEIMLGLALKGSDPPVVQDEKIGLGKPSKHLEVAPVRAGKSEFEQEPGQPEVAGAEPVPAGLVGQGAGEEGLAHPGRAGDPPRSL